MSATNKLYRAVAPCMGLVDEKKQHITGRPGDMAKHDYFVIEHSLPLAGSPALDLHRKREN